MITSTGHCESLDTEEESGQNSQCNRCSVHDARGRRFHGRVVVRIDVQLERSNASTQVGVTKVLQIEGIGPRGLPLQIGGVCTFLTSRGQKVSSVRNESSLLDFDTSMT